MKCSFRLSANLFILCLFTTSAIPGDALAHGNISNLPAPVQIMQYRLLIYMNPDDLVSRNKMAMVLLRTNKLEEARAQLDYILQKDSKNFDALDGLGILLMKQGHMDEAKTKLLQAERLRPYDPMVHLHLYVLYKELGQNTLAGAEMERARGLCKDQKAAARIEAELKFVEGKGKLPGAKL